MIIVKKKIVFSVKHTGVWSASRASLYNRSI